jgi:hypothetical protein
LTVAGRMTIQRYPTGLLDFLGMQSTGDTPHELAQELRASVDLGDLYLSDRLRTVSAGGSGPITTTSYLAGGLQTIVPAGETWLVYSAYVTSTPVTAGATIKGNLAIFRQTAGQVQILPASFSVLAAELILCSQIWERPMVMRPGDQLSLYIGATTGAPNVNWTGYLYYAPIKI